MTNNSGIPGKEGFVEFEDTQITPGIKSTIFDEISTNQTKKHVRYFEIELKSMPQRLGKNEA